MKNELFFSVLILLVGLSAAHGNDPRPHFEIRSGDQECHFRSFNHTEDQAYRFLDQERHCGGLDLSDEDKSVITDYVREFNDRKYPFSSIHIVRQSQGDFQQWKSGIADDEKCMCAFKNETFESGWTAYRKSEGCAFNDYCKATTSNQGFNPVILFGPVLGVVLGLAYFHREKIYSSI